MGDVELFVHEQGEGRKLVALHGGPGLDGSTWFPALDPLAGTGWRVLGVDLRANGRSGAGDPARWTVTQMADDVEALAAALGLADPVVMGWSFGSFVTQAHMARYGSAAAYVLVGTVAAPEALHALGDALAAVEPRHLRHQVTASWEREASVQTAEECSRQSSQPPTGSSTGPRCSATSRRAAPRCGPSSAASDPPAGRGARAGPAFCVNLT